MAQLQNNEPSRPRQIVALVDDDEQIVQALQLMLTLKGMQSSVHASAESLLNALTVQEGRLLLPMDDGTLGELTAAVLDLNLPGMNGVDLVLRLRAMQPDLKMVMITAALQGILQERGAHLQGVACLSKPFMLESLEQALFGS